MAKERRIVNTRQLSSIARKKVASAGYNTSTGKRTSSSSRKSSSSSRSSTGATKRDIGNNQTATVTSSGQVTVRDKTTGKLIERYTTTPEAAKKFRSEGKKFIDSVRKEQALTKEINKKIARGERINAGDVVRLSRARADATGQRILDVQKRLATDATSINKTISDIKRVESKFKDIPKPMIKAVKKTTLRDAFKQGKIGGVAEELQKRLRKESDKQAQKIQVAKPGAGERFVRGIALQGLLGAARGGLGVVQTITQPKKVIKSQIQAVRYPMQTAKALGNQFVVDPVGTIAEFAVYQKSLNLAGKAAKQSPVGRFVNEELFIRGQPKEIRTPVRKIIKASKIQEKINPFKVKDIKKVDFMEVKSLTPLEAKALTKTLKQTDSVVFGSLASRTLSKKKTPIPKDVDLATRNVKLFGKKFINNIPKSKRSNYKLIGEKIKRISNGEAFFSINT